MRKTHMSPARVSSFRRAATVILALAALLLLASVVLAANGASALLNAGYEIPAFVIGGGGGRAENGGYTLDATIGQPVVGVSSSGPYELGAGFWGGGAAHYEIYLPVVLKNYS